MRTAHNCSSTAIVNRSHFHSCGPVVSTSVAQLTKNVSPSCLSPGWFVAHMAGDLTRAGGRSQKLGTLGPAPLGWGRGWPPGNTLLRHMRNRAEFRCSRSNGLNVGREVPKICGTLCPPLGMVAWLVHRNTLFRHVLPQWRRQLWGIGARAPPRLCSVIYYLPCIRERGMF